MSAVDEAQTTLDTTPAPPVMPAGVKLIGTLGDGRAWVKVGDGPSQCLTREQIAALADKDLAV